MRSIHIQSRFNAAATVVGLAIGAGVALTTDGLLKNSRPPSPNAETAGRLNPPTASEKSSLVSRSKPVEITIPAIGVKADLLTLGLNSDGTVQVPSPGPEYNQPGWYKYSPTPGQIGPSVILGHVNSAAQGNGDFYRLGALRPGEQIDVTLADRQTVAFSVMGVRSFLKTGFPTKLVYGNTSYAALRLITCGGAFDSSTGHYLSNTVVFAAMDKGSGLRT